jgi:hypothetical protein
MRRVLKPICLVCGSVAHLGQNPLELFDGAALGAVLDPGLVADTFAYQRGYEFVDRNMVGLCQFRCLLVDVVGKLNVLHEELSLRVCIRNAPAARL